MEPLGRPGHLSAAVLASRLHEITAGLSIGVGYLTDGGNAGRDPDSEPRAPAVLEATLADLKRLAREISQEEPPGTPNFTQELHCEARLPEIDLDLHVHGEVAWLPRTQAEVALLVCREALRNVLRHAGSRSCRIELDLYGCPFVLRARDWGAGIQPEIGVGNGLAMLSRLAADSRCDLRIASLPGMGTELLLSGPPCGRDRAPRPELDRTQKAGKDGISRR